MPREYSPYAIIETTFILSDPRYRSLRPTAKVLYLALWARAFQDRRDVLPTWYGTEAMRSDSGMDRKTVVAGLSALVKNSLIKQSTDGRITVLGARDKGNIKWKEPEKGLPQSCTKVVSKKRREEKRKEESIPYSKSFLEFWSFYPNKTGKGKAWDIWKRLTPNKNLINKMIATLEWQKSSEQWKRDGGKFIPHPTTWLNQRRWEDEESVVGKQRGIKEILEDESIPF